jgi:hypothetical protein
MRGKVLVICPTVQGHRARQVGATGKWSMASMRELPVARNEIFARHRRFFRDQTLANYFSQFAWYQPGAVEVTISQLEATNVDAIQLAEHQK